MAAQKELPQEVFNSDFVVKDVKPHQTGDSTRYAERPDKNQYASFRAEWDISTQGRVQYGWEKDLSIKTVSLEISITKRMRDAGKNQAILDRVTDLSNVVPNRRDLDLAHRFAFAWSTSYTDVDGMTVDVSVADGLALISTVHTLTGSATTYSNQITGNPQFSKGSLEIAEQSFVENSFNNLGEKIAITPDTILTTDDPNTIHLVQELLKATSDVTTNNSGTFNVYQGKYKHVKSARIATNASWGIDSSKRKYWFLIASDWSDLYISELNKPYLKTPMDGNNGEQFSSENWNYMAVGDYGICAVTGKWVRGSKGDNS